MSETLKKYFDMINLILTSEEEVFFASAEINDKIEYSASNHILRLHIKVDNFLPISLLHKVETTMLQNNKLAAKLNLIVRNADLLTKELLWDYIEYIKENKAAVKSGGAKLIQYSNMVYDDQTHTLQILVANDMQKNLLDEHRMYYQSKLHKYGIANVELQIVVDDTIRENVEKEIAKINSDDKKRMQVKLEQTKTVTAAEANNSATGSFNQTRLKKQFTNRNSVDMAEPTYNTLLDLEENAQNVVLHGYVIKRRMRLSKSGRKIFDIVITDETSSIPCLLFAKSNDWIPFDDVPSDGEFNFDELRESAITEGQWVALRGNYNFSSFDKSYIFYIDRYQKIDKQLPEVIDDAAERRVELHTHTKMSAMDGVSDVRDYIVQAAKWNWKAIAITDHFNVQSFPDAFSALKSVNKNKNDDEKLKLIYGSEMVLIDEDIWYVKNPKHQKLREAKFVVFDLETTGLSPEMDEIIEFGANVYDYKTGSSTKYDILIKPKNRISAFTTDLTHITNEMLEDKEPIEVAFKKITSIIEDGILVAHNANFDFNFLDTTSKRLGYGPLNNTVIDTLTLGRVLRPRLKNHRLGTVAKAYYIIYDEKIAHRADYDAEVLTNMFEHMWSDAKKTHAVDYDDDWNKFAPTERTDNMNFVRGRGYHINVLAKNQAGLKDLYKLVSISHTDTFMGSPKVFRSAIDEFRAKGNILVGSGCINGWVIEAAKTGTHEMLDEAIAYFDFIELQPLSVYKNLIQRGDLTLENLKEIILRIIESARRQNKMLVATSDAHYVGKNLKKIREIYIHTKGLGGIYHPLYDFKQRVTDFPEQHLRTTKEMLSEWAWLEDSELIYEMVVTNPVAIADMVDANIEPVKSGSCPPTIENVDTLLRDECYKNAHSMYGETLPEIVEKRLERELHSIIKHGFAVVYWISHLLVKKSLDDGYLVGSRGSVGSSFVATTSNITEVNPLKPHYRCERCQFSDFETAPEYRCGYDLPKRMCPECGTELIGNGHDIPFETFLGFDGDKVPDIDLNFSGEYQPKAHDFTKTMFGERNVFRAGTISTVAEKTAYGYVRGYLEKTDPNFETVPRVEVERLANLVAGTKRTTGQHPGGIIILPKEYDIEDFTPVNYPADDTSSTWMTTHFDFHSIHDNLLKMDILGHVDPTALRMLYDLTGVDPKKIPTNDLKVYKLFSTIEPLAVESDKVEGEMTGAIGLPEFGTSFVRGMLKETQPKSFADLVQISGLSHGTDVYLGNAQTLIANGTADISTVIGCRDDIMVYLMYKGLDSSAAFTIMESVRKGKGLKAEWIDMMHKHNVPEWYIESCTKIKYMFPKAHATAYVLMAYRVAWFKLYYPIEYYATWLSTRKDAFDLEIAIKGEDAVRSKMRDIKRRLNNREDVSTKETQLIPVFEVLLEMFERGIKIVNIDFNVSDATNFVIAENATGERVIYPPFNTIDSLGESVGESIVAARVNKKIKSLADLKKYTSVTQTQINIFKKLNIIDSLVDDEQMSFDF